MPSDRPILESDRVSLQLSHTLHLTLISLLPITKRSKPLSPLSMLTKLMSDQSGKYEAVPPSDIEEQQESDYGDDADYKSEEEVPLLSTRSIARTSSLPLLIFICISLIGLGLKLSFDLHSLNEDVSGLADAFSRFSELIRSPI